MMTRKLGRDADAIEVGAIGFGGWAIGGPFTSMEGKPAGWGKVDDAESVAAIHQALELGVTFFDTADVYGAGHSERILGQALDSYDSLSRESVVIATKFGNTFDPSNRTMTGVDTSPAYLRSACEASLRRLGAERIDLYQLHFGGLPLTEVDGVLATLESLVAAGKIRYYGWSTDDPARAAAFAAGPHCAAVQHQLNIVDDAPEMLAVCAEHELTSVNRGPLAMGLLTGKYTASSARLGDDDVRGDSPAWMRYFADGRADPEWLRRVTAVRELLTEDGRTLVQGALAWLLARSPRTLPIPGTRTVAQAAENAGALAYGPLPAETMTRIGALLAS